MLAKLLGYEMKAFGRILLPLYGALIILAVCLGFSAGISPQDSWIGFNTLVLLFMIVIISVAVMTIVLTIGRFYNNLLGKEGYLMFSLPVSTASLIFTKVISSVVWSFLSIFSGMLAIFLGLGFTGKVDLSSVPEVIANIFHPATPEMLRDILIWLLIITASMALAIVQVYAAIAIGHQWLNHRMLGSILAFLGFRILETIIAGLLGRPIGFIGTLVGLESYSTALFELAILIVQTAIYSIITWLLLDRRLNLE